MAIQVRRGNESDFDASKMLPGEWAVSLDTRYVRMCFAPGIVLRMSTYDAFEADMAQIQAILAECRNIQSAVQRIQTEVNAKASLTVEYANDAKESADRAYSEAERAKTYADNAEAVTGVQIATKDRAGLIKGGDNHIAEDGTLMLITTTDSTTQPNSHAGREMVLEIGGAESEQDSTAGNQLWNGKYVTTALTTETDTFVADTTLAGNIAMPVTVGKQYTLSINGTLAVMRYIFVDADGVGIGSLANASTTSVAPENAVYMKWRVNSYHAETDKIMLNEGTEALPYEKYTGGQPAPNPSYPMPIKNSKVKGVRTHHKNFLYNNNERVTTSNGGTFTTNDDGTITIDGTFTADTNYNIISESIAMQNGLFFNLIKLSGTFNGTINHIAFDSAYRGGTTTPLGTAYPLNKTIKYERFRMSISSGTTCNNLVVGFMVSEESYANTYEPYTSSEYTLSQPIDLYGMDDVQDIITAKPINRIFAKVVLDGSEDNITKDNLSGVNLYRIPISLSAVKYGINQMCSHLPRVSSYTEVQNNENTFAVSGSAILLNLKDITSVADLRTFLNSSQITVVYELAEEVTEELPIADQIGLNSLATYDGITYVEFIYEGPQPTFRGKYGTSEVGGMTLESLLVARNNELKQDLALERISALETTLVNNI